MEPRDRAAQGVTPRDRRSVTRFRLTAWSLVLVAVAFAQAPGRVVADTKLDLAAAPLGFLERALQMWDPIGAFGQVQNQAYGYLFPMGPFFAAGHLADLPPWVTQRLWWSVLLVAAFLGTVKLLSVLEIGVGWTRILAGFAFALSPRMLSVIGASSIEMWPSALAPWVLVPLVVATRRGNPRRLAALSALVVACIGGVNAVATFAAVPLAAWWIWSAPRGPRRRALMSWWPAFVLMGALWWLLPLFLLGRYSPPFLDYIESVTNTTFTATLVDAMRGTSNWVAYVDTYTDAGNSLITDPVLIVNGVVILALGVLGLARTDLPHRRFLVSGLLTGVALVTLGHVGSTSGFGVDLVRDLLDGALSPLRNTHKFDVLIRIPLVIGLCHGVTMLTRGRAFDGAVRADASTVGVGLVACVAMLGASIPAWTGHLAPKSSFTEVPEYWREAAAWLDNRPDGRAVLAPATTFGAYVWGRTRDEPLQPLATQPWAVRNVIPLAPGGNIEMLDTMSNALATGRGSEGLADFLRRAGIGTIVVRHDIERSGDVVSPELVRSTLESTPGVSRVAVFGPHVGGGPTLTDRGRRVFVDRGWQSRRPAIEMFAIDGGVMRRTVPAAEDVGVVAGDASSLLRLDELGLGDGETAVLGQDADERRTYPSVMLTDGNRRHEAAFGAVRRNRSASLTPAEAYRSDRGVHRYDEASLRGWTSVPRLDGARSLTASSSRSDIGAFPLLDPSAQPWAAFDADPTTSWQPGLQESGTESWLRLELDERIDVGAATITIDQPAGRSQELTVTTEQGDRTVRAHGRTPVRVDVGRVGRVGIAGVGTFNRPLAVSDVGLENVRLSRPLVLPELPTAWGNPTGILLQAPAGRVPGCLFLDGVRRCSEDQAVRTDEDRMLDRELELGSAGGFRTRLRVTADGGSDLTALLQRDRLATVEASSQQTGDPRAGALAAVDGRDTTGWVAADDDGDPTLTLRWISPRAVDELRLRTSGSLAASTPPRVRLVFDDGTETVVDVERGRIRFDRVRTSSVEIHLLAGTPRLSVGFDGAVERLPLGVAEMSVPDAGGFPISLDAESRSYPCGSGPTVSVNGREQRTRVVASPRRLLYGRNVEARGCGQEGDRLSLGAGTNRITVTGTSAIRPVDLLLTGDAAASSAVSDEGRAAVLATTHNTNPGWIARTSDGRLGLEPVVLDGWRQGWYVAPDRLGQVETSFGPGRTYRVMLAVGAVFLVALALVALVPRRTQRRWPTTDEPRRTSAIGLLLGLAVVAGMTAGVPGLISAGVGHVTARLRWRGMRLSSVVAPTAVLAAGVVSVVRPWDGSASWAGEYAAPQMLVLVALACLVPVRLGVRRPAFLRRRKGRSTTRYNTSATTRLTDNVNAKTT